jgi:Na+/H+ antiporter
MPGAVFMVGVALAVAILVGRVLAHRLGLPETALFVLLGVAASYFPGLPAVHLAPDVVLLLFLPPLIYFAGFFTDPRATKTHIVAIIGQAFGLTLVSIAAAAVALHAILPDLGWAVPIAFGAVIAPPDPVAATSALQRLGAPRRLVTILEGEGLVNDGVALTVFGLAIEAAGAPFSFGHAVVRTLVTVLGGIGYGLVVGIAVGALRKRVRDTGSQVVLSLLTPYLAFVPADRLHLSGVLATVGAAAWLGSRGRGLFAPTSRLETESFWRVLNLLLVAALFVLLGLQIPAILGAASNYSALILLGAATTLVAATVGIRLVWTMSVPPLIARQRWGDPVVLSMPRSQRLVLGWSGPRGAVSLAIALSLPLTLPDGSPFPRRDLLLFLTVVIVLATLVGQGATLPALLKRLGVVQSERERTERLRARHAAAQAALRELNQLPDQRAETATARALHQVFELRLNRLRTQLDPDADGVADRADSNALRLRLIDAQRAAVRSLYDQGDITSAAMVEVSQDLDQEETRLRGRD